MYTNLQENNLTSQGSKYLHSTLFPPGLVTDSDHCDSQTTVTEPDRCGDEPDTVTEPDHTTTPPVQAYNTTDLHATPCLSGETAVSQIVSATSETVSVLALTIPTYYPPTYLRA